MHTAASALDAPCTHQGCARHTPCARRICALHTPCARRASICALHAPLRRACTACRTRTRTRTRYDLNAQMDEGQLGAIFQSVQLADATLVVKLKRSYGQGNEVLQQGQSPPLGSAPARPLCLLRARLAALAAPGARASRLRNRPFLAHSPAFDHAQEQLARAASRLQRAALRVRSAARAVGGRRASEPPRLHGCWLLVGAACSLDRDAVRKA